MIRNIIILLFCSTLIYGQQPSESVAWDVVLHDFDTLYSLESVYVDFDFTSLKETPLFIDNVRTTCGCAAPDWSYDPIAPGVKDKIKIKFTPKTDGYFEKKIKVFFKDQKKPDLLIIKGFTVLDHDDE